MSGMSVGAVSAELSADPTQFASAIARAEQSLASIAKRAEQAASSINNAGSKARQSLPQINGLEQVAARTSGSIKRFQGDLTGLASALGGLDRGTQGAVAGLAGVAGMMASGGAVGLALGAAGLAVSKITEHYGEMKRAAAEAAEAAKRAADDQAKQLEKVRDAAREAHTALLAFQVGASPEQYRKGQDLVRMQSNREELMQTLPTGGTARIERRLATGVAVPAEQKQTYERIQQLNARIEALTEVMANERRLVIAQQQQQAEQAVMDALVDAANKQTANEEAQRKKHEEAVAAYRKEEQKLDALEAWYRSSMGTLNFGQLQEVALGKSLPATTSAIGLLGADARAATEALSGLGSMELKSTLDHSVDPMDALGPGARARVESGESTMADELRAKEFIERLNDPTSDLAQGLAKMADEVDRAGATARGFQFSLDMVDVEHFLHSLSSGSATGALDAAGSALGAQLGGMVTAALGGADGGLGAIIGGVIGGILGNALGALIDVLGVLTPLFDGVAIVIKALYPIISVLALYFEEVGYTIAMLAPLVHALAEPFAAAALIFVRWTQITVLFFEAFFLLMALGWGSFEVFTASIYAMDQAMRWLVEGALWLYNGFVDFYNAIIGLIRLIPAMGDFGITANRRDTNVEDLIGTWATSMDDIMAVGEEQANATDENTRAVREFTRSLTNVPSWYRVGLAEYQQEPERGRGRAASGAPTMGGGVGALVNNGTIHVVAEHHLLEELREQMARVYGRGAVTNGGRWDKSNG